MDYDKALREGELDERMAYAWLKSGDPTAKQKLEQYAQQLGKQSIYELFPGKRGETVFSEPETDAFYDAQSFASQMGLPVDPPSQRPNQISPGSRMSLADLENKYGSLDLDQPATLPDKELVLSQDLKSESKRPDFRDPKIIQAEKDKTPAAQAPVVPAAQAPVASAERSMDSPAEGSAAFVRRAYQNMPDYLPGVGTNTKQPNRAKQQLQTEEKRLLRNEINARIKSDKENATRAIEDERLAAINDQYRDIFANSSKDRSAEDFDAMGRDQKLKLIRNYNENMRRKSMESPQGQSKPAAVRPDGSPVSQQYFDKFFNNPNVPDLGNMAGTTSQSMVPVYGPEGVVGYKSRSETAEAAKNYAKKSMRNSPMSTTGNVFSGNMEKLYPTLPVNRFKEEVDFDEIEKQKKYNPFA